MLKDVLSAIGNLILALFYLACAAVMVICGLGMAAISCGAILIVLIPIIFILGLIF